MAELTATITVRIQNDEAFHALLELALRLEDQSEDHEWDPEAKENWRLMQVVREGIGA